MPEPMTQQEAEDALYRRCAAMIHRSRDGKEMPIGEMSIGHLRATIRALNGSWRKHNYEVVLERKEGR